jgi:hypothetical protein
MLVFKWCHVNQQHNTKKYKVSLCTRMEAANLMNEQINNVWWRKYYKIPEIDLTILAMNKQNHV